MTVIDSERRTMTMPVAWGKDKLTEFFDAARSNQVATFANKQERFAKLREIDDCFLKIGENLINPQNIVPPFLLLRSHASFRGASSFAMSGQAAEAYVMMRSGLEHASYASLMSDNDTLAEIWLRRHDSEDALKKVRKEFSQAALVASIGARDAKLAKLYEKLYQDAIDFGAHPNERSVTGNMKRIKENGQTRWEQVYLHGDGIELEHALKYTAQAGLCCLHIFAHIFTERFVLLGLVPRIRALREGL